MAGSSILIATIAPAGPGMPVDLGLAVVLAAWLVTTGWRRHRLIGTEETPLTPP